MGGIDPTSRRPMPLEDDPFGAVARANEKRALANEANAPWLASFTESVGIPYPAPFLPGAVAPASASSLPTTLSGLADEILRLRRAALAPNNDADRLSIVKRTRDAQSLWLEKARAAGMKEPSSSFSPWTASNAELGSAFLYSHLAGVVPLDAAKHDGGLQFREDIFEALALRTRGLDDELLDSYATEPATQRILLERELHRLRDATQCKPDESVDELRLRRAKLLNAPRPPQEDRALYIGLDGKVGTFQALVSYELEERILAGNPGTTTGSWTATLAIRGKATTEEVRAAGELGNAVENLAGVAAGFKLEKLGRSPPPEVSGRRSPRARGPGLGRRTRSAGGAMPRRNDGRVAQAGAATAPVEARSRTPAGLNDKHLGGEIRNGRAIGFHHEASASGRARLVGGTATAPDARGVYRARVEVKNDDGTWVAKGTPSTFFPKDWTRTEVRTAILEAYANRSELGNGDWRGKTAQGMLVIGHSDTTGVIDSAYPEMEGR